MVRKLREGYMLLPKYMNRHGILMRCYATCYVKWTEVSNFISRRSVQRQTPIAVASKGQIRESPDAVRRCGVLCCRALLCRKLRAFDQHRRWVWIVAVRMGVMLAYEEARFYELYPHTLKMYTSLCSMMYGCRTQQSVHSQGRRCVLGTTHKNRASS